MQYTLITKTGKTMSFYIKEVAEMYQRTNGGILLDISPDAPKSPVSPHRIKGALPS